MIDPTIREHRIPRHDVLDLNLARCSAATIKSVFDPILFNLGFDIMKPITRYLDLESGDLIFTQKVD